MENQYSFGRLEEKLQLQQINDRLTSYVTAVNGSKNYACSEEDFNRRLDIYKKNYDKQVCDLQNEVQRLLSDNCLLQPFKLKFEVLETEFHQRVSLLNENLRKQNEVNTQLQVEISNKDVEIEKLKTQIHLPTCQLETMNIEMGELNKQLNFSETRISQLESHNQQMEDELFNSKSQISFDTQNHLREISELQSKLEKSRCLVISLEEKLQERSRDEELNIAAIQQQAKEGSDMQVKRFISEHENKMNSNFSKANMKMKADFHRIVQLQDLCDVLQNKVNIQNDELYTSNNALLELRSENENLKSLLESEQKSSKLKYNELEDKLQEAQDMLTVKLWELKKLQSNINLPLQSEISNISSIINQEEKRLGLGEELPYNSHKTDGFSVQNGISYNQSVPLCTTGPIMPTYIDDTPSFNNHSFQNSCSSNGKLKIKLKQKVRPKTANGTQYFKKTTLKDKFELPEKLPTRPSSAKNCRFINAKDASEGRDHFQTLFNQKKENCTSSSLNSLAKSTYTDKIKSNKLSQLMSNATGNLTIIDVNTSSIKVLNTSKNRAEQLGNCTLQQNINGNLTSVFRFPLRTKLPAGGVCTVWANASQLHNVLSPPDHFVCKQVRKWNVGPNCTTILCKPNGQAVAWKSHIIRKLTRPAQSFKINQKQCHKKQTDLKLDENDLSISDQNKLNQQKMNLSTKNECQKLKCSKSSNHPVNVTTYNLADGRRSLKLRSPTNLTSSQERHEHALQWMNSNKMNIFPPNSTAKKSDIKSLE